MTVRFFDDVAAEKGFEPDDRIECIKGFGTEEGPAWTFVLLARMRGWDVTDPINNGMGYYHVYVWRRGPEDPQQIIVHRQWL